MLAPTSTMYDSDTRMVNVTPIRWTAKSSNSAIGSNTASHVGAAIVETASRTMNPRRARPRTRGSSSGGSSANTSRSRSS